MPLTSVVIAVAVGAVGVPALVAGAAGASPSWRGAGVIIGDDVAPAVRDDVRARLRMHGDGAARVAIGDTPLTRALISRAEVAALRDEGFIVKRGVVDGAVVWAGDGRGGRGKSYAAYAILEALGWRFGHPLAAAWATPAAGGDVAVVVAREEPRLRVRNIHLHTMHPIELTNLLEGFGDDAAWRAQLPLWDAFLVWLLANRQNEVEWVMLSAPPDDDVRRRRLRVLVDRAHAFGVDVGIDAPIAMTQQHAWRLLRAAPAAPLAEQRAEIDARLDALFALGFDFVSTESGDTELTHPAAERMLAWMNEVAAHAARRGKRARIKVHCSAGQSAAPFVGHDGAPLDFNFLPLHADRRLGIEPHTVQMYALDDAAAPVYGNRDFAAMRALLTETAGGSREVLWYPESAYWVSVDVDVPLFLPVYARARVRDLEVIDEDGARIDGQSLFSSGWEWGFWLNDVVAARAAWRRPASLADAFAAALPPGRDALARELAALADDEHALLVDRGAIAWLSGRDAFDELLATQPRRPPDDDEQRALAAATAAMLERHAARLCDADDGGAAATRGRRVSNAPDEELCDAAAATALRARHVEALLRGDVAKARALRAQAQAIVARRERAYRAPAWVSSTAAPGPTAYAFGYLGAVHDLFYWRRDEETFARAPWLPCHTNDVAPADIVYGPGLLDDAARSARAFLVGTGVDALVDLGNCISDGPRGAAPP